MSLFKAASHTFSFLATTAIVLATIFQVAPASAATRHSPASALPRASVQEAMEDLKTDLLGYYPNEKDGARLSTQLQQYVQANATGYGGIFARENGIETQSNDTVRVVVETIPGQASQIIEKANQFGARVDATFDNLIQLVVPIGMLNALAKDDACALIRLPRKPIPEVISEGIGVFNVDDWQAGGFNGAGVKVGILDAGFSGYSSRLGSDLPAMVTTSWNPVIPGLPNSEGTSIHGTACAEIIYDVAPNATFYLARITTDVEWAVGINWLISQGVNVISCSLGFPGAGPGNGTGAINAAVNNATNANIFWSQAAGNDAQIHWSGTFSDTDADGVHNFTSNDEGNTFYATQGNTIEVYLNWNDPWGASGNDYDLLILNNSSTIIAVSEDPQDGNDYPIEGVSFTAPYSGNYAVAIGKAAAIGNSTFHLFVHGAGTSLQYQVATGSISVPADNPNVMTVGAFFWNTPYGGLEPFSSQGPTTNGTIKPDVTAPDGVSTVSYGTSNGNAWASGGTGFFGTSAAAPHGAGAAILVKVKYPIYTAVQIKAYLESNAIDQEYSGKDNIYGSGRLCLPTPEIIISGNSIEIVDGDSTPSTADGTEFGNIGVTNHTASRTFGLENIGQEPLILTGNPSVTIGGLNANDFIVTLQPSTPVPPGAGRAFSIVFDPSGLGVRTATVSITNNDANENPYTFSIQGTGVNPSITVTSPNGGENWTTGTIQEIRWNSVGVGGYSNAINLEISRDGGSTWSTIKTVDNTGNAYFEVTSPATSQAKIRVSQIQSPYANDTSDLPFTIVEAPIKVIAPNGNENWLIGSSANITWATGGISGNVNIFLSRDGGINWSSILNTPNDGIESWVVMGPATSSAKIRVETVSGPLFTDSSDATFAIPNASIIVTAPITAEVWGVGESKDIIWTTSNLSGNVKIEISRDGPWTSIVNSTANDGTYSWTVTGPENKQCYIRVSSVADASVHGGTGSWFTITSSPIMLTSPNGGESWSIGSSRTIIWWTSGGLNGNVKIQLSLDGGSTWSSITADTTNDGSYNWTVLGVATSQAKIRISSVVSDDIYDVSDANFNIVATVYPLTITGITATNKVYNGNTSATLNTTGAILVGVEPGDNVTMVTTGAMGAFIDKSVGAGKTVNISGLTITGPEANKYVLTQPATTANITAKALTVTGLTGVNRTYDGTLTAPLSGTPVLQAAEAAGAGTTADGRPYTGDTLTLGGTASGALANKNVGTAKPITVSGITLGGAGAGNYTITQPTGITANITQKSLTVGATGVNKIYDGTTAATVTLSDNRVSGDTLTTAYTTATFASKNVAAGTTVSVSGIVVSGTDSGNYQLSATTALTNANITRKNLTITGITAGNKTYDGTITATLTGTAALQAAEAAGAGTTADGKPYTGDTLTLGGTASGAFADKNVGTAKPITVSGLSISGTDSGNYNLTPVLSANITQKSLTVGATGVNKIYDGTTAATVTLSDNRVSGDTLTTAYTTATFASKNVAAGTTVSVSGIVVSGTDSGNYQLSATTALTNANITRKNLTITGITAGNKTYDGTITATLTGTAALQAAEAAGAGTTADGKPYTGDTLTLGGTASGAFADKNVGTAKPITISGLSISGTDSGNYNLTPVLSANITAKALTVTGLTGVNRTYDGTLTAPLSGTPVLQAAEAAGAGTTADGRPYTGDTLTLGGTASGALANKNVGTAKPITVSGITLGGAGAGNYTITQPTGITANITQKSLTVGATGVNKIYDGTTAATVTLSDNRVSGDTLTTAYTTATFASKNVAAGTTVSVSGIVVSGTDSGNYQLSATTALTNANITRKNLTITGITAGNKTYDGTITATLTGTAALQAAEAAGAGTTADGKPYTGDTLTLGGTASGAFADKNVGTAKPITVSGLSISGTDSGNYNLTPVLSANITQKSLTVGATGVNKIYDGTTAATVTLSDNRVSGDTLTTAYTTATFASKNVAAGTTVSVSGIVVSGTDSGNYQLSATTALTNANITRKNLTITGITAGNKTYDGTITATLTGTAALQAAEAAGAGTTADGKPYTGDTLTLGGTASGAFADKNVGTAKPITISGLSISGTDSGNYNLTPVLSANITAKALTVTGLTGVNRTYDGTLTAPLSGTPVLQAAEAAGAGTTADGRPYTGDTLTLGGTASGALANKNVGTAKPITVSGITLGGAGAGNYTITQPTGITANISAKTLTAKADNQSITSGSADPVFTISYTGFITGENSSVFTVQPLANVTVAHTVVGTYPIIISGGAAANYTFNYQNGTLTVTAAVNSGGGGGGGGGGGFGNQLVGINLSGTSPWMDGNGKSITAGQISTPDGKLTLSIPAGVFIWNAAGAAQPFVSSTNVDTPPSAPSQQKLIGCFELGPTGVTFNPGISIRLTYSTADLAGGYSEGSLYIAWWNGTAWVKLDSTVDMTAKTVMATTTHFTIFGMLAQAVPPTTTPPPTATVPPPITSTTPPPMTTNPPTIPPAGETTLPITTLEPNSSSGNNPPLALGLIVVGVLALGIVLYGKRKRPM